MPLVEASGERRKRAALLYLGTADEYVTRLRPPHPTLSPRSVAAKRTVISSSTARLLRGRGKAESSHSTGSRPCPYPQIGDRVLWPLMVVPRRRRYWARRLRRGTYFLVEWRVAPASLGASIPPPRPSPSLATLAGEEVLTTRTCSFRAWRRVGWGSRRIRASPDRDGSSTSWPHPK